MNDIWSATIIAEMTRKLTRRSMLRRSGWALAAGATGWPAVLRAAVKSAGVITGNDSGAAVGERVLADGGNAVDAAMAAALTACVTTPASCGVAGYGGHMIIGLPSGLITTIDFNTVAPASARPDMFPRDDRGVVKNDLNMHGWLSVSVPGTLSGIELAIREFGTRPFRVLVQPAIEAAKNGFPVPASLSRALRSAAHRFQRDPGSNHLYYPNGQPPKAGDLLKNPELAEVLQTLAQRNSVDSFYRGDIAQRLAESILKHGGLVTTSDLAAYHARQVKPIHRSFNGFNVHTAPLSAGGFTVLQALAILARTRAGIPRGPGPADHAKLEAVRLAWKDRLEYLADPEKVPVPTEWLFSNAHIHEAARLVEQAVESRWPVPIQIHPHLDEGTVNICACDSQGMMVDITLTQGGGFGAQVSVAELGMTLSHGMSRFDPRPDHPNAPGPGKRPLHNMCPSIVTRAGRPVVALGGAGGVKIPNAIYEVLCHCLFDRAGIRAAVAAPRLQCTGLLEVTAERNYNQGVVDYLKNLGFKMSPGESAHVSAVSYSPNTGECSKAFRWSV